MPVLLFFRMTTDMWKSLKRAKPRGWTYNITEVWRLEGGTFRQPRPSYHSGVQPLSLINVFEACQKVRDIDLDEQSLKIAHSSFLQTAFLTWMIPNTIRGIWQGSVIHHLSSLVLIPMWGQYTFTIVYTKNHPSCRVNSRPAPLSEKAASCRIGVHITTMLIVPSWFVIKFWCSLVLGTYEISTRLPIFTTNSEVPDKNVAS